VSTTTLLKHFPGKEALVFDQDDDQEAELVAAVRDRAPGVSVPQALRAYVQRARVHPADGLAEFRALVAATPALREHGHRMWLRHEDALARAIAETAPDDPRGAALAHFTLEASALAQRAADPEAAVDAAFDLLERGWSG
jgi:AcrR family transcriptional regulator